MAAPPFVQSFILFSSTPVPVSIPSFFYPLFLTRRHCFLFSIFWWSSLSYMTSAVSFVVSLPYFSAPSFHPRLSSFDNLILTVRYRMARMEDESDTWGVGFGETRGARDVIGLACVGKLECVRYSIGEYGIQSHFSWLSHTLFTSSPPSLVPFSPSFRRYRKIAASSSSSSRLISLLFFFCFVSFLSLSHTISAVVPSI